MHPKEALAKRHKDRYVQYAMRGEIMDLHTVRIQQTTHKVVQWEA